MAEEDPEIWVVIDADRPIDAIQEEVQSIVLSRLE
jgi:thymidylate kinase